LFGDQPGVEERSGSGSVAGFKFDPRAQHARECRGFGAGKLILDSGDDVFRRQYVVARHAAQAIERFLFCERLWARDATPDQDERERGNSDQSNAKKNEQ
jgi:hypothetical protein